MEKKAFVTKKLIDEITKTYPTPFHIYDEKGIRENIRRLKKAFSWNKGYKEYFAVKATPNPYILKIFKEEGCGVDCSSLTELMLSDIVGFKADEIMFSSNVTANETIIANNCFIFFFTIKINCDSATTKIDILTYFCITNIC